MNFLTQNIWCVGRNYADHTKEMHASIPKTPLIFLKSGNCLNPNSTIQLPEWSKDIHHEIELAFLIDENLSFSHITLALDLTARDAQNSAKKKGDSWTLAKSFHGACPVGSWISILDIKDLMSLNFFLKKNNIIVQQTLVSDMLFKPPQLLSFIRDHFPIAKNDIILTGTPAGVGPIYIGDVLHAEIHSEKQTLLTCHWDII